MRLTHVERGSLRYAEGDDPICKRRITLCETSAVRIVAVMNFYTESFPEST
jgi:hypothetical protein